MRMNPRLLNYVQSGLTETLRARSHRSGLLPGNTWEEVQEKGLKGDRNIISANMSKKSSRWPAFLWFC